MGAHYVLSVYRLNQVFVAFTMPVVSGGHCLFLLMLAVFTMMVLALIPP